MLTIGQWRFIVMFCIMEGFGKTKAKGHIETYCVQATYSVL